MSGIARSVVAASVRPVVQGLEARTLLSGGADAWVVRGDLSRRHPNDSIVIDVDPADASLLRATINGTVSATRARAGLRAIEIGAGRGDDRVSVELGGALPGLTVSAWGGFGNDRLVGDAGAQAFYGGPGDDRVDGAGGDDTLHGNDGGDDLAGGDGNDWLSGDGGHDSIAGGWGRDRLLGDAGSDQLDGGEGRDKLDAGPDKDTVKGGEGRDAIAGGAQRDWVYVDYGVDSTDDDALDRVRGDWRLPLTRVPADRLRATLREAAVRQWESSLGQVAHLLAPPCGGGLCGGGNGGLQGGGSPDDGGGTDGGGSSGGPVGRGDHSKTNTQEADVDEADLVKTDGSHLYSIASRATGEHELVVTDAATLKVVSRRAVDGFAVGLYLMNGRLTVVSASSTSVVRPLPPGVTLENDGGFLTVLPSMVRSTTTLTVLDVATPAAPRVLEETTLNGSYVDSRAVGDRVYAIVQNTITAPPPALVKVDDHTVRYESRDSYLAHLDGGWLDEALPGYVATAGGRTTRAPLTGDLYAEDGQIDPSWQPTLTVALLDVGDGKAEPLASTSVSGWDGEVYASAEALYLAQAGYAAGGNRTDLYQFTLGTDAAPLAAAGRVDGRVLNQFSMDEEGEHFRLATTNGWGAATTNAVYVLDQVGADLRVVGETDDIAPGESLFATRFIGDRGYVVTFLQTDPLFTLDLSDPANPTVVGELIIPGFSRYLHPIDETHLIGIGQDADATGRPTGVQVSLFDVADIANPKRVAVYTASGPGTFGGSEAEDDHHAFSYFPEQGILAFPVTEFVPSTGYETRLEVLRVSPRTGFTPLGTLGQQDDVIRRSVRIGDRLFAVGNKSITVADLEDPADVLGVIAL